MKAATLTRSLGKDGVAGTYVREVRPLHLIPVLWVSLAACDSGLAGSGASVDGGAGDRAARTDRQGGDRPTTDDTARPDAAGLDRVRLEAGKPDYERGGVDASGRDSVKPDSVRPDSVRPDSAKPDSGKATGLTVPCQHGPGFTLFRFHYDTSKSPIIDVWSATCSYSYAPSSACNVYAVYPGFGSVSYTSDGYPVLTNTEYLRVRFSVAGLAFTKASVHLQARSYATASSTYYRVWSPLYGGLVSGPVDNDWVYDWYSLDWSSHLTPADAPAMTAIQIYADQGSGALAVRSVELCVQ